jgi:hypothetical protein
MRVRRSICPTLRNMPKRQSLIKMPKLQSLRKYPLGMPISVTYVTRVLQMLEASGNASRFADTTEYASQSWGSRFLEPQSYLPFCLHEARLQNCTFTQNCVCRKSKLCGPRNTIELLLQIHTSDVKMQIMRSMPSWMPRGPIHMTEIPLIMRSMPSSMPPRSKHQDFERRRHARH